MKEVVIVGGGIIGVCTAYYLQAAGLEVTVVDDGDFASGCTHGNAGMIVPSHFVPLASPGMMAKGLRWMLSKKSPFYIRPRLDADLLRWLWLFYKSSTANHVQACAPLLRDMHEEGKEAFRSWQDLPGLDFEFATRGILMLYHSKAGEKAEWEGASHAHSLGIEAVPMSGDELVLLDPSIDVMKAGGVYYPGDATVAPDVFMKQMIALLKQRGVNFLSRTHIIQIDEKSANHCVLKSEEGNVMTSKHVVVANGVWASKLLARSGYHLPLQDGKGYSMTVATEKGQPGIPAILHEARVAITPFENRLRVSGTLEISGLDDQVRDHKMRSIVNAIPQYYRGVSVVVPESVWFGYRPCSPDGMPYIGRAHEGSAIIIATGHAMMGLSLAPATGRMIRDLMLHRLEVTGQLRPDRFRLRSR